MKTRKETKSFWKKKPEGGMALGAVNYADTVTENEGQKEDRRREPTKNELEDRRILKEHRVKGKGEQIRPGKERLRDQ